MTDEQWIHKMMDERFDKFTLEFGNHIAQSVQGATRLGLNDFRRDFENYKKEDEAWKKTVQPLIETFANLKWGQKVLIRLGVFVAGFIGGVWGIIQIIQVFIHYLRK